MELEEAIEVCRSWITLNPGEEESLAIKKILQALKKVTEERDIYKEEHDKITKALNLKEGSLNPPAEFVIESLKKALENSIPKKKIEEYLAEETEKYKVYKKEVDKNENLRGQLWHHMGAKNMCEKILGIEKTVTLY